MISVRKRTKLDGDRSTYLELKVRVDMEDYLITDHPSLFGWDTQTLNRAIKTGLSNVSDFVWVVPETTTNRLMKTNKLTKELREHFLKEDLEVIPIKEDYYD